jgi:hypothetical protein
MTAKHSLLWSVACCAWGVTLACVHGDTVVAKAVIVAGIVGTAGSLLLMVRQPMR